MKKFKEELENLEKCPMCVRCGVDTMNIINHFKDWVNPEELDGIVQENLKLILEVEELKLQLEKQKPEIPEFVADWLDKKPLYTINSFIPVEVIGWSKKQTGYADLGMNINHLLKLKVNGYTVAKEKRFYLRNKLTGLYLRSYTGMSMDDTTLRFEEVSDNRACGFGGRTQFTQQEIDSMETGSYEQIEVEE